MLWLEKLMYGQFWFIHVILYIMKPETNRTIEKN